MNIQKNVLNCPICGSNGRAVFATQHADVAQCIRKDCCHHFVINAAVDERRGIMSHGQASPELNLRIAERNRKVRDFLIHKGVLIEKGNILDFGAGQADGLFI